MTAVLAVRGVGRAFGGVVALKDVDLELLPDQILGLIGPNGAGKTTLFNVISGFIKPDRGRILLGELDLTALPPHRIAAAGVGRTFQNVRVFAEMTVLENVMVGHHAQTRAGLFSAILKLPSERREERETRDRARALLEPLGLADRALEPAANLPFGKMRLLEIARALAGHPRALLLDEPAAGLNQTETGQLGGAIKAIRDQGVAIILVEHDMRLVMEISDRVVVLNQGMKLCEGPPREVQNHPEVIAAYLGEGPDPTPSRTPDPEDRGPGANDEGPSRC